MLRAATTVMLDPARAWLAFQVPLVMQHIVSYHAAKVDIVQVLIPGLAETALRLTWQYGPLPFKLRKC